MTIIIIIILPKRNPYPKNIIGKYILHMRVVRLSALVSNTASLLNQAALSCFTKSFSCILKIFYMFLWFCGDH